MFNWFKNNKQASINELDERLSIIEEQFPTYLKDVALSEYKPQLRKYNTDQELLLQEVCGEDMITHTTGTKAQVWDYMNRVWIAACPPQFVISICE